jgi:hypothetical protein
MGKFFFKFFILSFLLLACTDNANRESHEKKKNENQEINENSIIGQWGGLGEKIPVWDIRKDSIFYYQHLKSYPYKISDNNMLINFEDSITTLRNVIVKKDTLFFTDDAGLFIKGYRFK